MEGGTMLSRDEKKGEKTPQRRRIKIMRMREV